jgi:transglutaminase-like putative cysteine protease
MTATHETDTPLARKSQWIVWSCLLLFPASHLLVRPELWHPWSMLVLVAAGLMAIDRAQPQGKVKTLLTWAMATGYALSYLTFFLKAPGQQIPLAFFALWVVVFLLDKSARSRVAWFSCLGITASVVNAGMLCFNNENGALPAAISVGITTLATLYLAATQSEAFPDKHQSRERWSLQGHRWRVPLIAMTVVLGLGFATVKQAWKEAPNHPSIGLLPAITASNAIVMKATFDGPSPEQPYWQDGREYVMPWSGGKWTQIIDENSDSMLGHGAPIEKVKQLIVSRQAADWREENNVYQYSSKDLQAIIYELPGRHDFAIASSADPSANVRSKTQYTWKVWKRYKDLPLNSFAARRALYLSIPEQPWTTLPEVGTPVDLSGARKNMPKTWALVQSWKQEGLSDEQMVQRTLDYFRDHLAYNYDHQSQDPDKNQLDWFLFEDRKGVCRHFANAFALMMRMAGIPSQVRGGFLGGQFDIPTNTWTVRARDAHAWTEIWTQDRGWVRMDPTAVVPVEKGVPESASLGTATQEWIQNVDLPDVFETAGNAEQSPTSRFIEDMGARARAAIDKRLAGRSPSRWMLIAPLLVFGLLVAGSFYRAWRQEPAEARQWRQLLAALSSRGACIGAHEGPRHMATRMAQYWPPQDRHAWLATVERFEQWKYGGRTHPTLARELRQWRRRKRQFNQLTP